MGNVVKEKGHSSRDLDLLVEGQLELGSGLEDLVDHLVLVPAARNLLEGSPRHVVLQLVRGHKLGALRSPFLKKRSYQHYVQTSKTSFCCNERSFTEGMILSHLMQGFGSIP